MLDRDVSYFLEVAEMRSLGRAAESLAISQSTLSRAIQRLEAQYGVQLLHRLPRGVELTAAGMLMADSVREMARLSQGVEHTLGRMRRNQVGGLKLGLGVSCQFIAFQALVPQLLRERPGMNLELDTGQNRELLERLEAGQFDAILIMLTSPAQEDPEGTVVLGADELTPFVRDGHPLLRHPAPQAADLVAYPWVGLGRSNSLDGVYDQHLEALGTEPPHRILTSNTPQFMLKAVQCTDCIGVATSNSLRARPGLRPLRVPDLVLKRRIGILRREERTPSFVLLRAIELIQNAFQRLGLPDAGSVEL